MIYIRTTCENYAGPFLSLLAVSLAMTLNHMSEAAPPAMEARLRSDKIDRLVKSLGSDEFAEWEAASKSLEQIGGPALPRLRSLVPCNIDPDLRLRAAVLVRAIEARERRKAIALIRELGGKVSPFGTGRRISHIVMNTRAGDQEVAALEYFPEVYALSLIGAAVTDSGLKHLRGLKHLELLDLSDTRITGTGLEHLHGLPRLKNLALSKTLIVNGSLAHLHWLPRLEYLDLSYTRVTDSGLRHLKRVVSLRELVIDHTKLTDAVVKELQKTLPNLKVFR